MSITRATAAMTLTAMTGLTLVACGSDNNVSGGDSAAAAPSGVTCEGSTNLTASGSTAQSNAITKVFGPAFADACSGANIDYTGGGSGKGVTDFSAGLTNFGGSDSPLKEDEQTKADANCGSPALNLPLVFGPIAVGYKLDGVTEPLAFSAATLAKIFTGAIKTWNDPAIAAENVGVTLPATPITVVFRSDESGTTDNFQKYLASAAPAEWTGGAGKKFVGGTGQGAEGNPQVAATVSRNNGAITYAEWAFATAQKLSVAKVITSAGPEAVELNAETVGATIANAKIKKPDSSDLTLDTTAFYRPTAAGAYPIVLATYELVCTKYKDAEVGSGVKTFLKIAASAEVQNKLAEEGYAPIPDSFRTKLDASIDSIS